MPEPTGDKLQNSAENKRCRMDKDIDSFVKNLRELKRIGNVPCRANNGRWWYKNCHLKCSICYKAGKAQSTCFSWKLFTLNAMSTFQRFSGLSSSHDMSSLLGFWNLNLLLAWQYFRGQEYRTFRSLYYISVRWGKTKGTLMHSQWLSIYLISMIRSYRIIGSRPQWIRLSLRRVYSKHFFIWNYQAQLGRTVKLFKKKIRNCRLVVQMV